MGANNVDRVGKSILITHDTGLLVSGKGLVTNPVLKLASLGRWAAVNVSERLPAEMLVYRIRTPTRDRHGHEGNSVVMVWEVETVVFGKINWDNFSNDMLLNLVQIQQMLPASHEAVKDYCRDDSRSRSARTFCQNAVRFLTK